MNLTQRRFAMGIVAFFTVVVLACSGSTVSTVAAPGAPGLGDPLFPLLGNGGYDAQHYTIDLTVDMERNFISGVMTLDAVATGTLSSFNLDFRGMEISAVKVNGRSATYARENHELTITPSENLRDRKDFSVSVAYSGVPEEMISQLHFLHHNDHLLQPGPRGWIRFGGGVRTYGAPSGSSSWYPVNEHPSDKATYTLKITVPKPFEVAANGSLEKVVDHGETATYVWEVAKPMASLGVSVTIAEFEVETATGPNGLPVLNYFQVGVGNDSRNTLSRTDEIIDYFSELFGPYPFESYGATVLTISDVAAHEGQTRIMFSERGLNSFRERLVAHELAHQWFGGAVNAKTLRDVWLVESFARYAERLWREHLEGPQAFDLFWQSTYRKKLPPPGQPSADDIFQDYVFQRGDMTLHALRLTVGDEAFFRTLRTYVSRYRYSNASTDDFVAIANEVSGQDLGEFFDAWLFAPTTPEIPDTWMFP